MLVIWGRTNSSNVQKLLWACAELGIAYERHDAGMAHGVVDTPPYRALNPNGKVPTIEEDGFVLWESNSVLRYLATSRDGEALYPVPPRERASVDRWLDWQLSTLQPAERDLFWGMVRTRPEERDATRIDRAREASLGCWRIVDAHLAGRDWLEAGRFTLADLVIGTYARRWFGIDGLDRPNLPNLAAWFGRIAARDAFRAHLGGALS